MNSQNLRTIFTGFPTKGALPVLSPPSAQQLVLHEVAAVNNSGSVCNIGIGASVCTDKFKVWTVQASITEVAKSAYTSGIQILPTTNNYGFIVQSAEKFSMLVLNVTVAETGSPVYAYQYWNGSAWTTLATQETPVYTSTGKVYLVFIPPFDWTLGGTGIDSNKFSIRILATTAPTAIVTIDGLYVVRLRVYRRGILDGQYLQTNFFVRQLLLEATEALFCYFSIPSASNIVEAAYQVNG